jgi:hypothetical protein
MNFKRLYFEGDDSKEAQNSFHSALAEIEILAPTIDDWMSFLKECILIFSNRGFVQVKK